jgi:methyl-accepting chemotaxis protein
MGGTKLSEHTTESAREIALITQEQRKATTQVDHAMEEMTQLLNHTIQSIKQATTSAESLTRVSRFISTIIRPPANGERNGTTSTKSRVDEAARRLAALPISKGGSYGDSAKEPPRPDAD